MKATKFTKKEQIEHLKSLLRNRDAANDSYERIIKKLQTFKFDGALLEDLKKESKTQMIPFNRYVENLLKTHPKRKRK